MRLATYNVEWFNNLFDEDDRLRLDDGWSGRYDVRRYQQFEALAMVFGAMDADAVMVIEAPDSHQRRDGEAALEHFAQEAGIRARKALIGFAGPRVIKQTIRQDLPDGFQRSEFLQQCGFVERVAPRCELRNEISRIIDYTGK